MPSMPHLRQPHGGRAIPLENQVPIPLVAPIEKYRRQLDGFAYDYAVTVMPIQPPCFHRINKIMERLRGAFTQREYSNNTGEVP